MTRVVGMLGVALLVAAPARAQPPGPTPQPPTSARPMPMAMPSAPLDLSDSRDGSGTSWLPDNTIPAGPMRHQAGWMLMTHWNAFGHVIRTGAARGDQQAGSINWVMGMASRNVGGGLFSARVMLSAEPLTVGRCGYPDLLQSGESCDGAALHDRQHPHDLFMEVTADYRRAISKTIAVEFYGGPAGEPALGPVAFPHRPSALPNPIAPISHHWLDATHVTFGVATAGLYGERWKIEGSVFNGREPDDNRYGFDLAALDSFSARLSVMPTSRWSMQMSAGRLTEAEIDADGRPDDLTRLTASVIHHRIVGGRLWATTVAWGVNRTHAESAAATLVESAVDLTPRDQMFVRGEAARKSAGDLSIPAPASGLFTVAKFQGGYTRWLPTRAFKTGIGASLGLGRVPSELDAAYGRRTPIEFVLFATVRPR